MKLYKINETIENQANPLHNDSMATVGLDTVPTVPQGLNKDDLGVKPIPQEPDDHMKPVSPKGPGD